MSRHPRPVAINVSEDANNMRELGRVIETAGNMAKVEIFRRDECTRCKVCGFGSRDRIIAVATNTVGAKEHDEVELELEAAQVVRAAVIVYIIPLIFLLFGLYLGTVFASHLGRRDIASLLAAVLGFGFLGLSYLGIAAYSKRPTIAKYQARVVGIVSKNGAERGDSADT
jgi:sigma-E factor negative regulatory protein RseC